MAWEIDAERSHVHFTMPQTQGKPIHGRFTDVEGYLYTDGENLMHSWVDIQVGAASIDTGSVRRDEYLCSGRFLDVATYPLITFKSTRVEHSVGKIYRLSGDLTLHGVTRPHMFSVEFDEHESTRGPRRGSLTASSRLRCSDFGLVAQEKLDQAIPSGTTTVALDLTLVSRSSPPQPQHRRIHGEHVPPAETPGAQVPI